MFPLIFIVYLAVLFYAGFYVLKIVRLETIRRIGLMEDHSFLLVSRDDHLLIHFVQEYEEECDGWI